MAILSTYDISKKYANHRALDKVSIEVPEKSIFGLLGPNGAGKTTLLRIINHILYADEGEISFQGKRLTPAQVRKIGYLPEERGLYKKMKVGEQALYLARLKGMKRQDATKQLKSWFERFEMAGWWNRRLEELSKGMQQKVQFVITVMHEPELIIFDEPFSGFDPINATLIRDEILELRNKGATIIFSTHNMASVEELCEHIALIDNAKMVLEGQVDKIRRDYMPNVYEMTFAGYFNKFEATLNPDFEIVEMEEKNNETHLKVKIRSKGAANDVLAYLMKMGEVLSFKEYLPGMNEVFIKAVEKSSSKSGNQSVDNRENALS